MKKIKLVLFLLICTYFNVIGQKHSNVEMRYIKSRAEYKVPLDRFYLNHAIYSNCFLKGGIYEQISIDELTYISNEIVAGLRLSLGVQFFVKTGKSVPYRFSVSIIENGKNDTKGLAFLTNYNPQNRCFEETCQPYSYASACKIYENKVIGGIFTLDMKDEEKFLNNNDHLSLLQLYIFNGMCDDKSKMVSLFEKAEQKEGDKINCHWLKSFYNLYQRNFSIAKKELTLLKELLKTLPLEKQNAWHSAIAVLEFEIDLLQNTDSETTMHNTRYIP
ncbi:hypothetical protein GCQ56_15690 [Marinifilum sp. N1E240]|uniref:hypothetical protein n=1 Tax=Marinifilum sp. N1E240 TaxID=2608082 RepID=UPI00128E217F|nr:hypothetical protein [Marinifilum sp. N1E240]MPQ48447.1 hypothetical protein [Marinifilum sp. N1E240]